MDKKALCAVFGGVVLIGVVVGIVTLFVFLFGPPEFVLVITYSNSTHTDMLITDMSIDPSGKSNAWKNVFGGLTLTGAFGHYFPTKKLILYCGGENERSWEAYSDCRWFNISTRNWTEAWSVPEFFNDTTSQSDLQMIFGRSFPGVVSLNNSRILWITGGKATNDAFLSDTEFFNVDSGNFSAGPPLKEARAKHCVVQVDENLFFIGGGFTFGSGGQIADTPYLFDMESREWTKLGRMGCRMREHKTECGVIEKSNGDKVVVVPMLDTDTDRPCTALLDVATGRWSMMPADKRTVGGGGVLMSEPGNDNVLWYVGGIDVHSGKSSKEVWRLAEGGKGWRKKDFLSLEEGVAGAIIVPVVGESWKENFVTD